MGSWADRGSPVGDLPRASPMGDLPEPSPVGELVRSCVSPVGDLSLSGSAWPSLVSSFGFRLLGVSLEFPPMFPTCSDMSLACRLSWCPYLGVYI